MSPTATSKIISNGAMSARVRRLSPRVRISRKTKMTVARTTISIRASSRHHPGVHVDAHHRHVGVEHGNAAAGAALDRWTDPGLVEEADRPGPRRGEPPEEPVAIWISRVGRGVAPVLTWEQQL